MKKLLLFSFVISIMTSVLGQSTANYTFSTVTTGTLEDMSSGTTTLVPASTDDATSTVTDIGFTFVFMGIPYTQFTVTSNGLFRFGSTPAGNTVYSFPQLSQAIISPFVNDLETSATGKVHSKLAGISPNRRLIVEWLNMGITYQSTTSDGTYQAVIYEGTGKIDFIYGAMAVSSLGVTTGYVTGISSSNTDNTYATVTTATNTVNTTGGPATNTYVAGAVIPNLNSVADGSRRVYTFTPPAAIPNAPSALNFTSVTPTGMTLNWTDNSSDETGFAIFRSDNGGVTYNYITTLAAGTVTYPATGLVPSTNYFWSVYAVNEGRSSTALTGNQATAAPPPPISGIKNIPSVNYPNFVAAFDSIINLGIGPGGVIFNVAAGYSENATTLVLTNNVLNPPTAANPILFQKNGGGANPVISRTDAGSLTTSTLGGQGDAVIIIQGADYVTFDGIDVSSTNSGIEYGYYLRKAGPTDGCKNVAIKNANITMTKGTSTYVVGIYCSNNDAASLVSSATGITVTSTSGRNENVTITGNTIGNVFTGIVLRGFAAATPYDFYDQNIVVGSAGAGNTIQNFAGNSATTSYGIYMIYQNMANISYNTLNNMNGGGTAATTLLYGIFNSTGTNSTFIARWNTINLTQSGAAGALYGINTASTGNLTLENNNVTLSTTATTSGTFGYLYNSSAAASTSVSISNNTFTGSTIAVTGTTYLIYNNSSQLTPGVTNIQNNMTSGTINRTGASGSFYCYYNNGSPTGTENINGNNFSNITLAGTSVFYGISSTTASAHTSNIFNNVISSITGGSGTMYGTNLTIANNRSVYGNTIHTFSGGGTVYGIYITAGNPANIYRNNIYNLSSSPAGALVYGIYTGGGTVLNIYNNFISDLKAPAGTGTIAIAGMYFSSGTNINAFYNTIYLNATSTSVTTFGTSGIYASTTPVVDLRNNIIMNISGNIGATGYTVAYRRSSTTISSYAATSNNNDFYAGTPGAKNLIFFDGTNADQTLAAFRNRVAPADGQSVSVIPPFTNVAAPPYDLTIQTGVATAIESGGIAVTSPFAVTNDFQLEPRYPDPGAPANVGFAPKAPDIGADEFGGLNLDVVPPAIVYTPLINTGLTGPRTLVATITDVTGVPVAGLGLPVLYWNVNAGAYTPVTATSLGSNQYSFTFGGGVLSDVFSYYIVAQDLVAPPNIGAYPWVGVTTYTADPPACSPAPTNPSTYTIVGSLSGTKTVGTGGDYLSLTGVGGAFADINAKVLASNLTLSIISDLTEDGTNALNQWLEEAPGNFTVTIQPNGTTERLISGAVALSGMIRLNGADRLMIDGRSGGSGKYLRFRNTNTANPVFAFLNDATNNTIRNCYVESPSTSSSGLLNFSTTTGTTGNDNNMITDNVFRDRSDATGVPSYMIYSSGTAGKDNSANTINNNEFANFGSYGIYITTGSAGDWTISNNSFYNNLATPPSTSQYPIYFLPGSLSTNNLISGNFIGGQSANCGGSPWVNTGAITFYGIYLSGSTQTTSVQNNTIQNLSFTNTGGVGFRGIYAIGGTLDIGTVTGNLIGSLTVPGSITVSGTTSPYGIYANTNLNFANNTIANLAINNTTAAPNCMAIYMTGNYQMNVYNNRILNIGPTSAAANTVNNYPTAGIMLTGAPVLPNTYNVYNNLISMGGDGYSHDIGLLGMWFNNSAGTANVYFNSIHMAGAAAAGNTRYSVAFQKQGVGTVDTRNNIFSNFRSNGAGGTGFNMAYFAADITNITSDNNDLYTSDPTTVGAWGGFVGTFAWYQGASGKEVNSVSVDPMFVSYTDFHTCRPELNNSGVAIPAITTDFAGVTRGTPPDIGAYEFSIPSPTIAGPASVCAGTTGVIYSTEAGMTGYSWVISAGGTITAGAGTNQVTVTWNTVGAQTLSVTYTNANGCSSAAPTVKNITVNPIPVPTIIGPNPVCVNSTGNVYSTEAGMSGYSWIVTGGTITAGTGTKDITVTWNVTGAQSVSVNYTNSFGCTAAAATVYPITVNPILPVSVSIVADANPVCAGTTVTFTATPVNGGLTPSYQWYNGANPVGSGGPVYAYVPVNGDAISVVMTSSEACKSGDPATSNTVTMTVNPVLPVSVSIVADLNPVCAGTTVTFTATPTNGGTTPSYQWKVNGSNAGTNNPVYSYVPLNGDIVTCVLTSNYVCPSGNPATSNPITMTVNPILPVSVSIVANANPVCVGTTVTFTATPVNGGTTPTYQWYNGANPVGAGGPVYSYVPVNGDAISVVLTSSETCQSGGPATSNTVTMTVDPVLPVSVTIVADANPVCAGTTVTYTANPVNGGPAPSYQWYNGANPVGGNSAVYSYTPLNGDVITCVMTSNYTCPSGNPATSNAVNMTVNALPVPSLNGPTPVCVNSTGVVYATDPLMTGYNWSVTGGTITSGSGTSSITVTWNTSGPQSVSVNYTDGNGCTAASPTVYPVTVNDLPVPTISGPNNVCVGITGVVYTTEPGMTGYTWAVTPGGTITSGTGTNSVTIDWTVIGNQQVSVAYTDGNGCTSAPPTSYNVLVNTVVTPTITGSIAVCAGTAGVTYTTETGMLGYLWTVSPGGTITAGAGTDMITVTWNTAGAQVVGVNYTDPGGCSSIPATLNVTVNALPVPTVTGPASVCLGITNTYSTEAGMTGYTWNVSGGGIITSGAGTDVITVVWASSTGVKTVSVNYFDANGCTAASATAYSVTVNPLPIPTITGPASVCQGATGVIYSTEAGMTGYTWNISAGGTITAGAGTNTVTVTWNVVGLQNVTVNYTNGSGCTATSPAVKNVTVNALPVPTISGPASACAASSGHLYITEPGQNGYNWAISAGGTITAGAGTNTVTVTWTTAGAQTISVNYINFNGCSAASPTVKNVTVNPLPVPTISGPASACAGTSGHVYTTEAGMTGYTWSVSAGGNITAGAGTNTITVSWITAGAQTVSVGYTNSNFCTSAAPTVYNVTVNPLPVPTITGAGSVCVGATGVTYTTEAGMTGYTWAVSAGGAITAGSGTNMITVTWSTVGAKTVSVSYTNGNGCTAAFPTIKNVTVNPLPVPTITGPASACAGSTGVIYTTETGMTGYTWSISAGGVITGGAGTSSVTVTWNTAGAQTISVLYTNANGCTAAAPTVKNVTVNPLPVPTITGASSVCVGTSGVIYTTEAGMTGYAWAISAGGSITAGSGTNSVTVTWNSTGAQTISVNYYNANGCTATTPTVKNVTVNPLPVPTISGPASACVNTTGNVYTTQTGMTGYTWTISAGGVITAGAGTSSITVTWNTVGNQSVCVNYTNANGCTALTPTCYSVTVNPRPVPTLAGPTFVCAGSTGNVYTTEAGMTNYTWTVSAGGTVTAGGTATSNTVTVTWNTAGAQTVTVNYNNASGCSATSPVSLGVTVNALPVPTISGPASVCVQSTGNIYSTQTGMSNYVWTVSAGGTIAAGAGTSAITVTWTTTGAKTVTVNYTNANGCTAASPTVFNVTVNPLPVPTITGYTSICQNVGPLTYTTESGMTNYIWTVSAGNTIVSGQGTNMVQVEWLVAGVQWISVNYTNAQGCSAINPTQLNVTVDPVPDPAGPITGTAAVCGGDAGVPYSVGAIGNATSYVWMLPAGATIATGAGTNSITVDFDPFASSGNIYVYGTNTCGSGASSPAFYVTVGAIPDTAGSITGDNEVCQGTSGVEYFVAPITNATGYAWTVPAGATIVAGSNTNMITVDFNLVAVSGVITVYGTNSCGNGEPGPEFEVTVNPVPPAPIITAVGNVLTSNIPTGNQWYYEGTPIPGATEQSYVATLTGTYWDVVTWNNCSSDTSNHVYVVITGLENKTAGSCNVFPVPNDGRFTLSFDMPVNEIFSVTIYNNLGVKVYYEDGLEVNGKLTKAIDLRPVPSGVYTVVFQGQDSRVVKKILINR